MRYGFDRLTREEIGLIAPRATALVPVAATEQHGPHLPVRIDTLVGTHIALEAAELAGRDVDLVTCPTLAYGASHHHLIYPGTLSLSTGTLLRVLDDLGDSLVASGFRSVFFLNGHGGNEEVIRLAAREIALRHDVLAGAASYWTLAWGALQRDGRAFLLGPVPGHAGGFETSLALALDSDGVRRDRYPSRNDPPFPITNDDPAGRPLVHRHGNWRAIDGFSDDARAADAETGSALLRLMVSEVASALRDFHRSLHGAAPEASRA